MTALHVSLVGRKDLSGEIYRQVRRAIVHRRLRPGDRLPPSRELARELAVARGTVTVAYERLAAEGFVTFRQGAGTFVGEFGSQAGQGGSAHRPGGVLRPHGIWRSVSVPTAFYEPARFDFRTGLGDASLFPETEWRRAVTGALRASRTTAGFYEAPAGRRDLRAAIARYIGTSRGVEASADDVVITNGTQQALDLVARVLLGPGDAIAVEDPGYGPPRALFRTLGLRVVGVPVDRDGLIVDALPPEVRAVYVTPSHQYPLSVTLTLPRRHALLAWAERNDAAIIEDDYDSEFRFGVPPVESLQGLDPARVVYAGTFSKVMFPSLRVGYLAVPPALAAPFHAAKALADTGTGGLEQRALTGFVRDGHFERHVRRVRARNSERRDALVEALGEEVGERVEVLGANAGLHVMLRLRNVPLEREGELIAAAERAGVRVYSPVLFHQAPRQRPEAELVLGYASLRPDQIREGIGLLARVLRAFERPARAPRRTRPPG